MAKSKAAPKAPAARTPWDDFLDKAKSVADGGKLAKALTMLRGERFQLYADVQPEVACGVVRSQSSGSRVYACRLAADGRYSCCTQNLITCVVSRGSPCKHLLVLVLGLVKAGHLPEATALDWLHKARRAGSKPEGYKPDKDVVTATFLKYKGMEAGEIDWRPMETVPEDFYAM